MYTKQEIINALNIIKDVCTEHESCGYCPFYTDYNCNIVKDQPDQWDIAQPDREIWRAFE